ncbi:MAG TPA: NAD-dependent protein deacetylase [Vicinamibacterales bacterium]|nr:NAD-dependent protein deacetylase [Vicinamibacterales bacterium]
MKLEASIERLAGFLDTSGRVLVLTGAGCSTESGIPDYRDANGEWKHARPVMYQQFIGSEATRQRYWARSLVGWRRISHARPNRAHLALARLEAAGFVSGLLTQNVDGLHTRAGSADVIDLHGRLDTVQCLSCGVLSDRAEFQVRLEASNPHLTNLTPSAVAPDGDAALVDVDYASVDVPPCGACGGILKPHVVFFGEGVPPARLAEAFARLDSAAALLVVGSSLMVFSGYRFVQSAVRGGKPVAAVNLGRTRADDVISLKVEASCSDALAAIESRLLRRGLTPSGPAAAEFGV